LVLLVLLVLLLLHLLVLTEATQYLALYLRLAAVVEEEVQLVQDH
jgi:hypothetical protein